MLIEIAPLPQISLHPHCSFPNVMAIVIDCTCMVHKHINIATYFHVLNLHTIVMVIWYALTKEFHNEFRCFGDCTVNFISE